MTDKEPRDSLVAGVGGVRVQRGGKRGRKGGEGEGNGVKSCSGS